MFTKDACSSVIQSEPRQNEDDVIDRSIKNGRKPMKGIINTLLLDMIFESDDHVIFGSTDCVQWNDLTIFII